MDDGRRISLKDKIKHYFCFSCCLPANHHRQTLGSESTSSGSDGSKRPLFLIGPSSRWIKSRASSVDLPEIKHKIFSQIGCGNGGQNHRHHQYHRRRRSSADFRYDPLSYALNFEEDSVEDDAPLKDFSARLPVSPPPRSANAPPLKTRDQEASSQPIAAV